MFQVRKDGFKDNPSIPEELDLVEEDDQFTHMLTLDDATGGEEILNVFKHDVEYVVNEEKYGAIKSELLEEDSGDSSGSGSGSGSDSDSEEEAAKATPIIDATETNLIALRRTIYLTIQSALDFEEAVHKLLKLNIKPGQEPELCHMIIDCCAQQRTYEKFFGLMGQRFCQVTRTYQEPFSKIFLDTYSTVHRLETGKLRNVAKFYSHLLYTDAIGWDVLSVIKLNEDDTTSSSRIFIKILFQELAEFVGLAKLVERTRDGSMAEAWEGLLPRDNPRDTRFAINFFTSIGLGGLTEDLRSHLKTAPKPTAVVAPMMRGGQESSESSSDSSTDSEEERKMRKKKEKKRARKQEEKKRKKRDRSVSEEDNYKEKRGKKKRAGSDELKRSKKDIERKKRRSGSNDSERDSGRGRRRNKRDRSAESVEEMSRRGGRGSNESRPRVKSEVDSEEDTRRGVLEMSRDSPARRARRGRDRSAEVKIERTPDLPSRRERRDRPQEKERRDRSQDRERIDRSQDRDRRDRSRSGEKRVRQQRSRQRSGSREERRKDKFGRDVSMSPRRGNNPSVSPDMKRDRRGRDRSVSPGLKQVIRNRDQSGSPEKRKERRNRDKDQPGSPDRRRDRYDRDGSVSPPRRR